MLNLKDVSDEKLLIFVRNGDISSFEEIYNRYWSKLYQSAYKRVKDKETSEEIVQDIFTSLWINRNELDIHSSLMGYLFNSVRYSVLNHIKKAAVRSDYSEFTKKYKLNSDNSTEESVFFNDLKSRVEHEINLLPIKCRSVYELSRMEYKTNKEISAELGISEKTVENHLTKALKRLRLNLNDILSLIMALFLVHKR